MEIEGYVTCRRCDRPVIREVARRTSRLCGPCIDEVQATLGVIEVQIGSRLLKIRTKKPHSGSRGSLETARQAEKAREAARKRLARMFPGVFEVLVADERTRRGMEPWPLEVMTPKMDPDELDLELKGLWATWAKGQSYPLDDAEPPVPPGEPSR